MQIKFVIIYKKNWIKNLETQLSPTYSGSLFTGRK